MINVKNLSFGYNKQPLCLKDVCFSVKDGEVLIVLGGEGMGKTALLRVLSGLEKQYFGKIEINNKDINETLDEEKSISYLPSEPVFLDSKSVKENINYLCDVIKKPRLSDSEIKDIFSKFSFEEGLYEKVKKLSLTNRRLLAIIRSYIKNADTLLVDDQFVGLPEEKCVLLKNALLKLLDVKNANKTLIIVQNDTYDCFDKGDIKCKYLYLSYSKAKELYSLDEVKTQAIDLFFTKYFDVDFKEYYLINEDSNYYLFDFETKYKNEKKQKDPYDELTTRIKLSDSFNEKLNKANLETVEKLKVALVSLGEYDFNEVNDSFINKQLLNNEMFLFDFGVGERII